MNASCTMALSKPARTFQDLLVWQKAHRFVLAIYALTAALPKQETYGLSLQMRRAAVSIPANIAEGVRRRGKDPAIVIATGLRAIFINGAFVVDQHGAVSLVAITHEHVPLRPARGGKQQCAGNPPDGLRFFGLNMYEHGRAATLL